MFEEARHATTATIVIESLCFDIEEVLITQNTRIIEIMVSRNTILRINRAANWQSQTGIS